MLMHQERTNRGPQHTIYERSLIPSAHTDSSYYNIQSHGSRLKFFCHCHAQFGGWDMANVDTLYDQILLLKTIGEICRDTVH